MQFGLAVISSAALLMASQALGAAVGPPHNVKRAAHTATDAYHACNCPNNCKHKYKSDCSWHVGYSDGSFVAYGWCDMQNGNLTCTASGYCAGDLRGFLPGRA
ncbi:hypothetical protein ANO14919_130210 [Xylariales sp. No.14919]|nr:hypothetical protein ANO14919_130210 [Xylariales sp. No.14919]